MQILLASPISRLHVMSVDPVVSDKEAIVLLHLYLLVPQVTEILPVIAFFLHGQISPSLQFVPLFRT